MRFGFLITARCNAFCTHCTVSSGPHESAALPTSKIRDLMDEAAALWERERLPNEDLQFCISGGEPFLDFSRLLEIVAHGSRLGAAVTCVTNGYWASSDEKARAKLMAVKDAGLSMLAVSTSQFHQRFVKLERVQRALDMAKQTGIRTALKCAVTKSDREDPQGLEQWAQSRDVDKLEVFPVMPYLREGATLPEGEYIRTARLPKGRCPAPTLTVREDGRAYTCCMPGGFTDFLSLGNVFTTGLPQIYDRFYLQGKQQVLRNRGPLYFARAIIAQGQGHRLRGKYEGVCDLCAHIASDPRMSAIAQDAAAVYEEQQLRIELDQVKQKPRLPKPGSVSMRSGP